VWGRPQCIGRSCVDVERFRDRLRTNPDQVAVREGLYRSLHPAFGSGRIGRDDCYPQPRPSGRLRRLIQTPDALLCRGADRDQQARPDGRSRCSGELAAGWLWVVALGGLLLWLGRRRRSGRRLRGLLAPERGARGRRRLLSWHGAIGLWVAPRCCSCRLPG
jgi:hypothetical protein